MLEMVVQQSPQGRIFVQFQFLCKKHSTISIPSSVPNIFMLHGKEILQINRDLQRYVIKTVELSQRTCHSPRNKSFCLSSYLFALSSEAAFKLEQRSKHRYKVNKLQSKLGKIKQAFLIPLSSSILLTPSSTIPLFL